MGLTLTGNSIMDQVWYTSRASISCCLASRQHWCWTTSL